MNKLKIITVFFFVSNSFNLLAQDSLLQAELNFYPLYHQKKDISNESKFSNGPTILLSFPLHNKLSLSAGFTFQSYSYNLCFNDSEYSNSMGYVKNINEDGLCITVPVLINYCSFVYKKYFSINISLGLEYNIWTHAYRTTEVYPLSSYIGDKNTTFCENLSGFNYWDLYNLSFQINTSIRYFPLKHWGVFFKPFVIYNLPFNNSSLSYGISTGICYR